MDLYIGNLPTDLDSEGLKKFIGMYASVQKARIIEEDGVSRGFGFVSLNDSEGQVVIDKLNGQFLEGKKISVRRAFPKKQRAQRWVMPRKWREKADEKT